jgi:aspartate 1-decarboxylase
MSKTALNLHIDMMKAELKVMESTNIKFGLLLKLIREASELISLEQLQIMDAHHTGRMQQYSISNSKQSSLEFYNEKYKTEIS